MSSSYLYLNGIRVHYLHWSRDNGGQPIVLLHDLGSNARIWDKTAPLLAQAGFSPLAIDLRSHGLTDSGDSQLNLDVFFGDLAAFIEALYLERPLLAGHGWGTLLALDYAARIQYGTRVPAGLVLVNGGMFQPNRITDSTWENRDGWMPQTLVEGVPLEDYLAFLGESDIRWHPDEQALQSLLASYTTDGEHNLQPRLSRQDQKILQGEAWEYPLYERYKQVSCPVLMAPARPPEPHSQAEQRWLVMTERGLVQARSHLRDYKLHWLEGCLPEAPLHQPGQVADLFTVFNSTGR
jgi:lipase